MARKASTPAYLKIAIDIASRIVNGGFLEGEKLSGRSTLVSIYNVSPETIRRAIALLRDMNVVEVEEKSGIRICSRDNALKFLEQFKTVKGVKLYEKSNESNHKRSKKSIQ